MLEDGDLHPRPHNHGHHRVDHCFLRGLLGQKARPARLLGALEAPKDIRLPGDVEVVGVGSGVDLPPPRTGQHERHLLSLGAGAVSNLRKTRTTRLLPIRFRLEDARHRRLQIGVVGQRQLDQLGRRLVTKGPPPG